MKHLARAIVLSIALSSSAAIAQDEEDPGESRAATFQAAEGAQAEEVPGGTLLIAAYGAAWILVFLFVGSIALRHSRVAADVDRLRKDLANKRGD